MTYRVEMLTKKGFTGRGEWVLECVFDDEPAAWRWVEEQRARDRADYGWSRTYAVVSEAGGRQLQSLRALRPVRTDVNAMCAELDGFIAELQREVGAR